MSQRRTGLLPSPQEGRGHSGDAKVSSESWICNPFVRFPAPCQFGGNAFEETVQLAAAIFGMSEH
jgi:hypothetical protein